MYGGKENEKLAVFAEKYVANRFQGLIVEQLAREQVPKTVLPISLREPWKIAFWGYCPVLALKRRIG